MVHVQNCCFGNQPCCFLFLTFSLPSASLDLKVPIMPKRHGSGNAVGESVLTKSVVFFLRKYVRNLTIPTALTLIKKMKNFEVLQVY